MALKVIYKESDVDSFNIFLRSIEFESEEIEKKMLKEAGEEVKISIVKELNRHRRVLGKRYEGRPAMADDVKVSIRTGKWGDRYVRVMGGKRTGTLWHLVNDGTLHTQGTHFMDRALARLDGDIDEIWDKAMRWFDEK